MFKRAGKIGSLLCTLILAAGIFAFIGCSKGPNLKGAQVLLASWSNAYDVNTYTPRNEGEELDLEHRKKVLADNQMLIRVDELSGWDDYFPIVTSNIMSGNKTYSMYALSAEWAMTLYKQGLLFPISDSSVKLNNRVPVAGEKQAYNKMMEDLFTFGGKQYAVSLGLGGDSWQGNFLFWNKRLFTEAGLNPDLLYDLQRDGTWTWDAFHNLARQLTRDVNNDGIIDIYGLPCDDAREVMNAFVYGNNANYVTIDEQGKFHNSTNRPEFVEALQFYLTLMNEGVFKVRPEGAAWDWDFTEFFDGRVAMLIAPEWRKGQMPEMTDDYGCVLPPKGPRATDYRMSLTEVVWVVPNIYTKAEVDVILRAFDLWNVPMDTDWKQGHYWAFRDRRAVDESVALTKDSRYVTYRNFALIPGYPIGEMLMDTRFWESGTASQIIESWAPRMNALIDEMNR
jgi:ABC-type glycerol-3-phosphate transport system substrate-binding protein